MTPTRAGPLSGKRVVVTRAPHQAGELDTLLRGRGAEPLPYPCITIAPPAEGGPLDAALQRLAAGEFAWLVLTSRNTVDVLADRLAVLGLTLSAAPGLALAAVGRATAEAAQRVLGLRAALVPDEFIAEELAAALLARLRPGERVLLCQADIARPVLANALAGHGYEVASVVAYRTIIGSGGVNLPALLTDRQVDAILFTSASTVRNFLTRLTTEGGNSADLHHVCVACLGPVTADVARNCGLTVHVVPAEHTLSALVDALEAHFAGDNP